MHVFSGFSKFNKNLFHAIITGLENRSRNGKTGNMITMYFIPDKEFNTNRQEKTTICGQCPLLKNKSCYVNTAQAPAQIFAKIHRNGYDKFNISRLIGKKLRLGGYGEPVLLPFRLMKKISKVVDGMLGYTHAWKNKWAQPYKQFLMASVESLEGKVLANSMGWKSFRIIQSVEDLQKDELLCPASKEWKEKTGKEITCSKCMLCAGNSSRTPKNIAIVGHGSVIGVGKNMMKYLEVIN